MPASADEVADLADSAPTAKTLKLRDVCVEPHSGHLNLASPFMVRTSCSNFVSQDLQVYS
jgi:hypothetical protein